MEHKFIAPSRKFPLHLLLTLILLGSVVISLTIPARVVFATNPLAANFVVYADVLATDWADWSWDSTIDLASATQVHGGANAIAVTYSAPNAGLSLRAPTALDTAGFTAVEFWVYGGTGGSQLSFYTQATDDGGESTSTPINAPAGTWTHFSIPLSALGNPTAIARLNWQEATGAVQPTFYVDDIQLIATNGTTQALPDSTAASKITNLDRPAGIAIAPNGRVFVAIFGSDNPFRQGAIQSWPNTTAFRSGGTPDIVLGKAGAVQVGNPESLTVDPQNRLYIADTGAHRVLVYNSVTTTGQQPDFVFGAQGISNKLENKFQFTRGLAVDSQNHLFVTDEFNDRILVYTLPIASNNPTPIAQFTGLNGPRAVAVDGNNNVYIADSQNGQVKVFQNPVAANHFATPDRTIGEQHVSDCSSTGNATSATRLSCPIDLVLDSAGNLLISDTPNHRMLGYPAGNSTPTVVYGQADFASYLANRGGAAGDNTLNSPLGMAFDSQGNLYLADFENNRVLVFAASTTPPPPNPDPNVDITLSVDVNANRKPISPYIYGLNYAKETFAQEIALPLRRWGGNITTRYNWQTNNMNHASDWFFHNNVNYDEYTGNALTADEWVQQNQRTNTESLLTVPMIGYVAKDGDQATCGFKISIYGPQDANDADSGFPDCGDGLKGGKPVVNNPLDTSVAVDKSFMAAWVSHLKDNAATNGVVKFYALDNEPGLWHETHRDVHPVPPTYDELRDLGFAYGAAVKAVDPNAQIFGPVQDGWTRYFYASYVSQAQADADRQAHGGEDFVPWYLQQMKTYETQHNLRLLDYLDLHFYPQNGVDQTLAGDATQQALRLRSTRALWDPTYVDESWIKDAGPDNGIVQLLPRMHAWVDENYPNTKLAITEYNWGGLENINGALAQADVLGIFGREGLDAAALWNYPQNKNGAGEEIKYDIFETLPGAYAFRLYRNYDGAGSKFGETSLQASSTDQSKLSIYAAQRSNDSALTLMIINKTGGDLTSRVNLANFVPGNARVYRYSANNLGAIEPLADQVVAADGFNATFPANSITLVVVPKAGDAQPVPGNTGAQRLFMPLLRR
ncbi:MAG: hypothetical protein NT075_21260 [Chloroflexi bacterium]|nr:hypothetical protein [Chloroflexota bacterium]